MAATLTVPAPTFLQDGNPGPIFKADKPLTMTCGPVKFGDGTPVTAAFAKRFGFLVYRLGTGGALEVWDEKGKAWVSSFASVAPQSLFPAQDPSLVGYWQAILVAAGQQDKAGNDKFDTNPSTGQPKYSARCTFTGTDATGQTADGTSPQSSAIAIPAATGPQQVGVSVTPMPPAVSTDIKLFLKDPSLANEAHVDISAAGSGFTIELSANGASLSITSAGDIVLKAAPGRTVQVQSSLLASQALVVNGQQVLVP